jgi:Ca2+-binding RTX toxin-like protein
VWGGRGNDTIFNDGGDDVFYGGKGRDTVSFQWVGQTPYQLTTGGSAVIFDLAVAKQTVLGFGTDH